MCLLRRLSESSCGACVTHGASSGVSGRSSLFGDHATSGSAVGAYGARSCVNPISRSAPRFQNASWLILPVSPPNQGGFLTWRMPLMIAELVFNDSDLSKCFLWVCMFTIKGSEVPASSRKPEIVMTCSNLFLSNNRLDKLIF